MFRPVGAEPASVYWRRRLLFLATLLVLIVLVVVTARVLLGGDGEAVPPAGQGTFTPHPSTSTTTRASTSTSSSESTGSQSSSSSSHTSATRSSSSSAAPKPCDRGDLQVQAVSDKTQYAVGDKPKVMLQVTNSSKSPCVQDLADPKVELRVYNGESRVWGSHDCIVQSGTNAVTLVPDAPVRVTVVWSGLSSRANSAHTQDACGPRQVVGAGTYTLYPYLAGKAGHASQFSIS